jgi:hypothetical protein
VERPASSSLINNSFQAAPVALLEIVRCVTSRAARIRTFPGQAVRTAEAATGRRQQSCETQISAHSLNELGTDAPTIDGMTRTSTIDAFDDLIPGTSVTIELHGDETVSGQIAENPGPRMLWITRPSGARRAIYRSDIRNLTVD